MRYRVALIVVVTVAATLACAGCGRDVPATSAAPPRKAARPQETPEPPPELPAKAGAIIFNAREHSDLTEFEQLLADRKNVRLTGSLGRTLLHMVAAGSGRRFPQDMDEPFVDAQGRARPFSELPSVPVEPALQMARRLLELGADVCATDDAGDTPLHAAARAGGTEMCKLLLEHGARVDARNQGQHTPLWVLAMQGSAETGRLLLDAGADPNTEDAAKQTPLHQAAGNGCSKLVELLLARGATREAADAKGRTALHCAAAAHDAAAMKVLLEAGADVGVKDAAGRTPLHAAAAKGQTGLVEMLLRHGASKTARDNEGNAPLGLVTASENTRLVELLDGPGVGGPKVQDGLVRAAGALGGTAEEVRFWLKKGADPSKPDHAGRVAIIEAAGSPKGPAVLRELAKAGADLNATGPGFHDQTPLHAAIQIGLTRNVDLLLELGADPDARDTRLNHTPLHQAAVGRKAEICAKLLDAGAKVDARTPRQETALHIAAQYGYTSVARVLIKHGADVNARDGQGKTPLKLAQNHPETIQLLAESGAKAAK